MYLPSGKAFYTSLPIEVALQVGRDPAIPISIYTTTELGGLRSFIVAGELTMSLLMVSFLISIFSVGRSLLKYSTRGSLGFRAQLLCLVGTVFFNFLAVISYMILTVYQLGMTGFYLNGFTCSAANVAVGLACMVVSFLADAVSKMELQQHITLNPSSQQYGAVIELSRQGDAAAAISDEI